MPKKILLLTGDYVDDYELMVPYSVLKMFGCEVKVVCPGRGKGDFIKTAIHYISVDDWDLALKGKPITYSESFGHPYKLMDDFDWENVEKEVVNEGVSVDTEAGLVKPVEVAPVTVGDNTDTKAAAESKLLQARLMEEDAKKMREEAYALDPSLKKGVRPSKKQQKKIEKAKSE